MLYQLSHVRVPPAVTGPEARRHRRAFRTVADPARPANSTSRTGPPGSQPGSPPGRPRGRRGAPEPANVRGTAQSGPSRWQAAPMRTVIVNGDALTVDDVVDVANGTARAELGPDVAARMEFSRDVVARAIAG